MTFRTTLLAAAAASSLIGSAYADAAKPSRATSIDLGPLAGVAYYTVEPKGYHVVVTLAPRAAAPSLRFEAVLASGQSVIVSTPRQAGAAARSIEISRNNDAVSVTPAPAEVNETASLD
ncbi:hypothetical protein [Methylobacterium nodulans]|uniref:Uncharacterized protein n=1 Tax=Methylobacterium nodulans (strain LMG 21967 / CNCM I-2342 / ORS 2060) TaxID=460265 RepID=B8IPT4_METNO|nr:hypothetical protein [Methylobacterium nodulans]ACL56584.1 conserved hypothetical protein [Methylobacterium nodulans ORS 2060]